MWRCVWRDRQNLGLCGGVCSRILGCGHVEMGMTERKGVWRQRLVSVCMYVPIRRKKGVCIFGEKCGVGSEWRERCGVCM